MTTNCYTRQFVGALLVATFGTFGCAQPVLPEQPLPVAVPPTTPGTIAPPAADAPLSGAPTFRRDIVRVSGGNLLYPQTAIRAGITRGVVIARFAIDETGDVSEIIIVSAEPLRHFDQAVIDWGSKYRALGQKYYGEVEAKFELKL